MKITHLIAASATAAAFVLVPSVHATPWSFGVMADTQQTGYTWGGQNTVSTKIISEVNKQFNAAGVDFVVQVGDLGDNGSVASLQTRLDANAGTATYLNSDGVTTSAVTGLDSGIAFFGLRGNHESTGAAQTFFQSNYIPTSSADYTVELAGFDNTSYAVTHNGTKIVLLDIGTAGNTTALDNATNWMSNGSNTGVLQEADHTQAFVFQHKNFLGQNHKDNAFGSSNDANPAQQNAFLAALDGNNVRYDMSGHDHMNHRAEVTSPDGASKVQQIICQSDSTKFYEASTGFSSRETTYSDQQNKIGYYIFTVDGAKVTGQYFAAEKNNATSNATIVDNPTWTLQDTFGYSLNGKQQTVARGGSYAGITDSTALAVTRGETGYVGTSMSILAGTNTTTATAEGNRAVADDLNTGWTPKESGMLSDTLSLWGMNDALGSEQTDAFALSLTYDPSLLALGDVPTLLTLDDNSQWVNTVDLNYGGLANFVGDRAYNAGDTLGSYGFDSTTHTAWAVVNHNSDFAVGSVTAVPEPAPVFGVVALALAGIATRLRRRRNA